MMTNNDTWYDTVDTSPILVLEVILSSGEIHKAKFVCGSYETMDGRVLYPVGWRALFIGKATYGYAPPFKID